MRNLATAQEGCFADSNRYALIGDTGSAPGRMSWVPSNGNTSLLLVTTPAGWSGRITIPGGQACNIFIGSAARPTGMPATNPDSVPVCW